MEARPRELTGLDSDPAGDPGVGMELLMEEEEEAAAGEEVEVGRAVVRVRLLARGLDRGVAVGGVPAENLARPWALTALHERAFGWFRI